MFRSQLLLGTLLILAVSATAYAQTSRFNLGFEGGPNLASLRGSQGVSQPEIGALWGLSGGVFLQYNCQSRFSLRTNVSYEKKGFAYRSSGMSVRNSELDQQLDYLTLPLLLRATFGQRVQFFVNAGPYVGYLLRSSSVFQEGPNTFRSRDEFYQAFDAGLSTGIGISLPFATRWAASAEVRNNLGLVNVSALPIVGGGALRTNSTQLLLGVGYRLGRASE